MTTVLRIAAFSDGNQGGNPAGVWIGEALPDAATMQAIAAEIGFSETGRMAAPSTSSRARTSARAR
jgi:predicted PhzF superfamily epimerase YddE/YHI9